jgi:hypothetical protein
MTTPQPRLAMMGHCWTEEQKLSEGEWRESRRWANPFS